MDSSWLDGWSRGIGEGGENGFELVVLMEKGDRAGRGKWIRAGWMDGVGG